MEYKLQPVTGNYLAEIFSDPKFIENLINAHLYETLNQDFM